MLVVSSPGRLQNFWTAQHGQELVQVLWMLPSKVLLNPRNQLVALKLPKKLVNGLAQTFTPTCPQKLITPVGKWLHRWRDNQSIAFVYCLSSLWHIPENILQVLLCKKTWTCWCCCEEQFFGQNSSCCIAWGNRNSWWSFWNIGLDSTPKDRVWASCSIHTHELWFFLFEALGLPWQLWGMGYSI